MYYFPMDFKELTLDGLIHTGALASAISEADQTKQSKTLVQHQIFILWWQMVNSTPHWNCPP